MVKITLFKAYLSMLFFDLIQFDGKYKSNRRQSKRVLALLRASLILKAKKNKCLSCKKDCSECLIVRFGEGKQHMMITTNRKTRESRSL